MYLAIYQGVIMKDSSNYKFEIFMIDDTYIDLEASSGRSYKTIPKHLREPDEGIAHVNTYSYVVNDPACMPDAGGMIGVKNLSEVFEVSTEHLKRNILPHLHFVKYYAGIPVTNVSSVYAAAEHYHQEVNQARCARLGMKCTECSSGSLY